MKVCNKSVEIVFFVASPPWWAPVCPFSCKAFSSLWLWLGSTPRLSPKRKVSLRKNPCDLYCEWKPLWVPSKRAVPSPFDAPYPTPPYQRKGFSFPSYKTTKSKLVDSSVWVSRRRLWSEPVTLLPCQSRVKTILLFPPLHRVTSWSGKSPRKHLGNGFHSRRRCSNYPFIWEHI